MIPEHATPASFSIFTAFSSNSSFASSINHPYSLQFLNAIQASLPNLSLSSNPVFSYFKDRTHWTKADSWFYRASYTHLWSLDTPCSWFPSARQEASSKSHSLVSSLCESARTLCAGSPVPSDTALPEFLLNGAGLLCNRIFLWFQGDWRPEFRRPSRSAGH